MAGRPSIPVYGQLIILHDAAPRFVEMAQIIFRFRQLLDCRPGIPVCRLTGIRLRSQSMFILIGQIVLAAGIARPGTHSVPVQRPLQQFFFFFLIGGKEILVAHFTLGLYITPKSPFFPLPQRLFHRIAPLSYSVSDCTDNGVPCQCTGRWRLAGRKKEKSSIFSFCLIDFLTFMDIMIIELSCSLLLHATYALRKEVLVWEMKNIRRRSSKRSRQRSR